MARHSDGSSPNRLTSNSALDWSTKRAVLLNYWVQMDAYINSTNTLISHGGGSSTDGNWSILPDIAGYTAFNVADSGTQESNSAARPGAGAWHMATLIFDVSGTSGAPKPFCPGYWIDAVPQSLSPQPIGTIPIFLADALLYIFSYPLEAVQAGGIAELSAFLSADGTGLPGQADINTWYTAVTGGALLGSKLPDHYWQLNGSSLIATRGGVDLVASGTTVVADPSQPLDIHQALARYLQGNATLATAFGSSGPSDIRFWADEAPDGTGWPYAVISSPDERFDGYQTADAAGARDYFTYPQFQIAIFAEGPGALNTAIVLGWAIFNVLQDAALAFARGTLQWFRLSGQHHEEDADTGPLGMDVQQRILLFQATVERSF